MGWCLLAIGLLALSGLGEGVNIVTGRRRNDRPLPGPDDVPDYTVRDRGGM